MNKVAAAFGRLTVLDRQVGVIGSRVAQEIDHVLSQMTSQEKLLATQYIQDAMDGDFGSTPQVKDARPVTP